MSSTVKKLDFSGRRVLVTGGGRGIGLGIVRKFLDVKAQVFVLEKDEKLLGNLAKEFPTVTGLKVDLSNWEATTTAVRSILPIHHVINNAAVEPRSTLLDVPEEDIDISFTVNFKATLHVSQLVAKAMIQEKIEGGTIVNVSANLDSRTIGKDSGMGVFSCSKAAVTMLTKIMAVEFAPYGIRVNCVRPGATNTESIQALPPEFHAAVIKPLTEKVLHNRLVETEEIADAIVFFSSPLSSMVTGTGLAIDGGFELQ